jgi:hypothetical protein
MKMAAPKPAETEEANPEAQPAAETTPSPESTTPKPGFKPRFNMKTVAAKPTETAEEKIKPEQSASEDKPIDAAEPTPLMKHRLHQNWF